MCGCTMSESLAPVSTAKQKSLDLKLLSVEQDNLATLGILKVHIILA